ncbi:MAG: hypothetical protein ACOYLI_02785 [Synechococcus lacustris]
MAGLLLLGGCQQPFAQEGRSTVWVEPLRAELSLSPSRRQWQWPVRIDRGDGEQLKLLVELECDRRAPASGLLSLTRLYRQDLLIGLDRRDPSLERSWGGADPALPPAWLRRLAQRSCPGPTLPSRWRGN